MHKTGAVDKAIEILHVHVVPLKEEDGAIWLESTKFGDKISVIIKSDGNAAYFAGDIAYYLDKKQRGADKCIILLEELTITDISVV